MDECNVKDLKVYRMQYVSCSLFNLFRSKSLIFFFRSFELSLLCVATICAIIDWKEKDPMKRNRRQKNWTKIKGRQKHDLHIFNKLNLPIGSQTKNWKKIFHKKLNLKLPRRSSINDVKLFVNIILSVPEKIFQYYAVLKIPLLKITNKNKFT